LGTFAQYRVVDWVALRGVGAAKSAGIGSQKAEFADLPLCDSVWVWWVGECRVQFLTGGMGIAGLSGVRNVFLSVCMGFWRFVANYGVIDREGEQREWSVHPKSSRICPNWLCFLSQVAVLLRFGGLAPGLV
jgi:hypothetical protein